MIAHAELSYAIWTHRYSRKVILLVILFVSWFGVKDFALANLNYYQVIQAVERWENQGKPADESDYKEVKFAMIRANSLHVDNPLYLDMLAQVYEWGVISAYEPADIRLIDAKSLYLSSTRLRPTWPVTWASLAMLKWRLGEFDQEMLDYLRSAAIFGPSQPEVHVLYTELGLALYQSDHPFFPGISSEVKRRLYLGLSHPLSAARIKAAVERNALQGTACQWLKERSKHVQSKLQCNLLESNLYGQKV